MTKILNKKIDAYLKSLYANKIIKKRIVRYGKLKHGKRKGHHAHKIHLKCWYLPKTGVKYISNSVAQNRLDIVGDNYKNRKFVFKFAGTRVRAARVPFLNHPNFVNMTASHLCHHDWCLNPEHVVFELLETNQSRNSCPGDKRCKHLIKCIRPGPLAKCKGRETITINKKFINKYK